MSVNNVPVQIGGTAVLGAAGIRSATGAASEFFGSLPATGGSILEHARELLIGGAGLVTVGVAMTKGGRSLRLRARDELD